VSDIFFKELAEKNIDRMLFGNDKLHYLTVGSIMRYCNKKSIVMGTGFISENDNLGENGWTRFDSKVYNEPTKILSVRGPKTRKKLLDMGIQCPEVYGDPLIIFPLIYNKPIVTEYDIGIIPHYADRYKNKFYETSDLLRKKYSVKIIDIECGPNYENFIDDINRCRNIISSSLHGVMMGLSYGKKTVFTQFSDELTGGPFKFTDFFESLSINYDIPCHNDPDLMDKWINIDKDNMVKVGTDILNVCPFIEDEREKYLKDSWIKHCNEMF
jgi:pyruvyltransferase